MVLVCGSGLSIFVNTLVLFRTSPSMTTVARDHHRLLQVSTSKTCSVRPSASHCISSVFLCPRSAPRGLTIDDERSGSARLIARPRSARALYRATASSTCVCSPVLTPDNGAAGREDGSRRAPERWAVQYKYTAPITITICTLLLQGGHGDTATRRHAT